MSSTSRGSGTRRRMKLRSRDCSRSTTLEIRSSCSGAICSGLAVYFTYIGRRRKGGGYCRFARFSGNLRAGQSSIWLSQWSSWIEAAAFGRHGAIPVAREAHSSRSRINGSTDSARCAGIHVASRSSNDIARTTPASTRGSRGGCRIHDEGEHPAGKNFQEQSCRRAHGSNLRARPNAASST